MSDFNRREFIWASLGAIGLITVGCSPTKTSSVPVSQAPEIPADELPDTPWPDVKPTTREMGHSRTVARYEPKPKATTTKTTRTQIKTQVKQTSTNTKQTRPAPVKRYRTLESVIPRSKWAGGRVGRGANKMGTIKKITIHHEGSVPVWFKDYNSSRKRVEQIRRYHTQERRWSDIGYHFVIDRGGRIWEGRPIQYQGAHVSKNNEQNVGILILGNFDKQAPSREQLATLPKLIADLRQKYKVSRSLIKSHQEINPTSCPGTKLQSEFSKMRSKRAFG